jgi:hypothetical protein
MDPIWVFRGPYRVKVTSIHHGAWPQRLIVTGSEGSDGAYPVTVGSTFDASGAKWTLASEYDDGKSWLAATLLQQHVAFDLDAGLVFTLSATDLFLPPPEVNVPAIGVRVSSTNPDLRPPDPGAPAPDFSLPESALG